MVASCQAFSGLRQGTTWHESGGEYWPVLTGSGHLPPARIFDGRRIRVCFAGEAVLACLRALGTALALRVACARGTGKKGGGLGDRRLPRAALALVRIEIKAFFSSPPSCPVEA